MDLTKLNSSRTVRFLRHEWTLASLGGLALSAVMTWPVLRHPTQTIPKDIWDPTLQAWQLAWTGHALTHDPAGLWQANAFYPESYSFAFSDTLLGYAPLTLVGTGPVAAVLRYNIIFVLIFALAFVGGYALLRQLGSGRAGAAVAGAACAYAPWRLGQTGHLHVLSTGGILLALAMLARGHGWSLRDGYTPERARPGWAVAGWLVAAWQISLGFGVGLPFAYVLLGVCLIGLVGWLVRRRPEFPGRLLRADLIGGLVFTAVAAGMAYPYLRVLQEHPEARRSEATLAFYSPPLRGFFIAPAESWLLGQAQTSSRESLPWPPEMAMLPGYILYALAAAGLFLSIWTVRQRLLLLVGVIVSVALAAGTSGPAEGKAGYLLLYHYLPGFDGIRTPGRLMIYTTLLLGVLAAGAVSALGSVLATTLSARGWRSPGRVIRAAVLAVPLALVLVEGAQVYPVPEVPRAPVSLRGVPDPVLILPTEELGDMNVMLWSTDGFPRLVNGGSGFVPQRLSDLRQQIRSFPDAASVAALRAMGVKTVLVLRDRALDANLGGAVDGPIDDLGITRTDDGAIIIYRLS